MHLLSGHLGFFVDYVLNCMAGNEVDATGWQSMFGVMLGLFVVYCGVLALID